MEAFIPKFNQKVILKTFISSFQNYFFKSENFPRLTFLAIALASFSSAPKINNVLKMALNASLYPFALNYS
jgi:hypothetical protein